jgi:PilZ domain
MAGEDRRQSDRRKDRRYNCSGRVRLWQTESGIYRLGSIVNLSMGGCLLNLPSPADFERHSIVEASFQSNYLAFRTLGSVRRVEEKSGLVGICYLNLSSRGRLDLVELFADLEALIAEGYWSHTDEGDPSHPHSGAERRKAKPPVGPFLLPP